MNNFKFEIKEAEGKKVINFANNSADFVEVVFTIDGREVKDGKIPNENTRGYAYPLHQ
jgi:flagellar hook assembly protein FlgD